MPAACAVLHIVSVLFVVYQCAAYNASNTAHRLHISPSDEAPNCFACYLLAANFCSLLLISSCYCTFSMMSNCVSLLFGVQYSALMLLSHLVLNVSLIILV